ncbi:unnamed protein product, partial [marine sediment metagenome]
MIDIFSHLNAATLDKHVHDGGKIMVVRADDNRGAYSNT